MTKSEIIKEYYNSPRISNSSLKLLDVSPRLFKLKKEDPQRFKEDTTALRIGSAVDCLLTDPEGWQSNFEVTDFNKPYGLMEKFVKALPPGITASSALTDYSDGYYSSGYKMPLNWVVDKF